MPDQRTLTYDGGPWSGVTVTIPAKHVADRRDIDDLGAYVLDGDTYTWHADEPPVETTPTETAEERPAEHPGTEETRPAAQQDLQERPARPRRTRKPQAG